MVISSKDILNKSFIIRFLLEDTLDSYIEKLDDDITVLVLKKTEEELEEVLELESL